MTIDPDADGGPEETHAGDQIVYVLEGEARNPGSTPLFSLTVYSPPEY